MTDTEREDLESGIDSAFWTRFKEHALNLWGEKGDMYLAAIKFAMQNTDDVLQRRQLEQVMFAQQEIRMLLEWPQHRIDVLNGKADEQSLTLSERSLRLRQQDYSMAGLPRRGRG